MKDYSMKAHRHFEDKQKAQRKKEAFVRDAEKAEIMSDYSRPGRPIKEIAVINRVMRERAVRAF